MKEETERILNQLYEKKVGEVKSPILKNKLEIYKNPTEEEVSEVVEREFQYLKFIADPRSRDVYIVKDFVEHDELARALGFDKERYLIEKFPGTAKLRGDKLEVAGIAMEYDSFDNIWGLNRLEDLLTSIINGKYAWLQKYNFDLSEVKPRIEDEIIRIEKRRAYLRGDLE